jgi:ABC-type ATPase with predicted acetyltransferase domain
MTDENRRRADVFEFEPVAPVICTVRTQEIASHFAIPSKKRVSIACRRARCPIVAPTSGSVMLLIGASGSGKSSLLRALRRRAKRTNVTVINLRRIALPAKPIVDLFDADITLERTLKRLARVGLAEVWTWLRPPSQLSEGQRWRLRLAIAIERVERCESPVLLVCDEFGAVLDRVSACIVSTVLRRAVDAHRDHVAALVATSHDDLSEALAPDVTVECDFGRVTVVQKEGAP